MTITLAGIDFDYHDYDERGDALCLHVGPPEAPPAKALQTPEGTRSNTTSMGPSSDWS
jgi:hypothetical protein